MPQGSTLWRRVPKENRGGQTLGMRNCVDVKRETSFLALLRDGRGIPYKSDRCEGHPGCRCCSGQGSTRNGCSPCPHGPSKLLFPASAHRSPTYHILIWSAQLCQDRMRMLAKTADFTRAYRRQCRGAGMRSIPPRHVPPSGKDFPAHKSPARRRVRRSISKQAQDAWS